VVPRSMEAQLEEEQQSACLRIARSPIDPQMTSTNCNIPDRRCISYARPSARGHIDSGHVPASGRPTSLYRNPLPALRCLIATKDCLISDNVVVAAVMAGRATFWTAALTRLSDADFCWHQCLRCLSSQSVHQSVGPLKGFVTNQIEHHRQHGWRQPLVPAQLAATPPSGQLCCTANSVRASWSNHFGRLDGHAATAIRRKQAGVPRYGHAHFGAHAAWEDDVAPGTPGPRGHGRPAGPGHCRAHTACKCHGKAHRPLGTAWVRELCEAHMAMDTAEITQRWGDLQG
jgi:hypothetical protein